ncbi:MAG: Mycinamicin VI 2''-O-methyltransferase [Pelotomaculum sp. PtaB.Bin104]|nr:MAG: Mycinamicin VI 2''-O-methyltransferase [Pelotomaculum sp. PtaB.Bin104]
MSNKTLEQLYTEHRGKVSDKWSLYLSEYERLFFEYRNRPVRLLEIGIQNGGSLEIWNKYFPYAEKIVGCDINPDCERLQYKDSKIAVVVGDAHTDEVQQQICGHSPSFDLIIDDGSHQSSDIIRSFARYFAHLNNGGLYVVEDLHCSYWQEFDGGLFQPYASISFFKHLVDIINHEHWGIEKTRYELLSSFTHKYDVKFDEALLSHIHSVEFINSICVIRKVQPISNVLGHRIIGGTLESVSPGHLSLCKRSSPKPNQMANPWTARDMPVEEELLVCLQEITGLNQVVVERDAKIAKYSQVVAERDTQIDSLRQVIAEHDALITNLNQAVAERDGHLGALYSSRSWRVTAPIRWVGRQMKRVLLVPRALPLTIRHGGGVRATVKKAVVIIRREGIEGVRLRLRFLRIKETWQPGMITTLPQNTSVKHYHYSNELPVHLQSVDVIVCIHNALEDVKLCLESLVANTLPPYRIIIIDDGSEHETQKFLENFIKGQPAILIRNKTAKGYTKAANTGLRASRGEMVVMLNSDTIVPPKWIDRLIRCALSDDRIGLVGPLSNTASWQSVPQVFNEKGDWADNPLPDGWSVNDFSNEVARISQCIFPRVGFLNGFCLLIKRAVIDDIGLFDEVAFARGYGEENDYCLRAVQNNWQLAVADDCYVFHAQSKSYSHDLRKELVSVAGKTLVSKHGQERIDEQLAKTRFHPALEYIRKRCDEYIPLLRRIRDEILSRFEGKRVLFLLPVGTVGGGGNIVLLECLTMRECGVDAWVANLLVNRELFEQQHPKLNVPVLYLRTSEELIDYAQDFDAVVATVYHTVFWMKPLLSLKQRTRLGYYIQDFEPYFFQEGSSDYQHALSSYTAIPEILLFTKTKWNHSLLKEKLCLTPEIIGPSLDVDVFHPSANYHGSYYPVRITAMVRPSTPRRAPEMTMRVLRNLKKKFKHNVEITIFGVRGDAPDYLKLVHDFNHQCLGELTVEEVKVVLMQSDIFVDCSSFQAMGLTAMEAMASGAVVVGPLNGGLNEFVDNGKTGLLVDTLNEDSIIFAMTRLIEDHELRYRMRLNAFEVLKYTPFLSVYHMLSYLFYDDIADGCFASEKD